MLQASLLEREVDGLLHEEVSGADIPLVQHGVRLDGGHAWGVLDLQRGTAVNCRTQELLQGVSEQGPYRARLPGRVS